MLPDYTASLEYIWYIAHSPCTYLQHQSRERFRPIFDKVANFPRVVEVELIDRLQECVHLFAPLPDDPTVPSVLNWDRKLGHLGFGWGRGRNRN